MKSWSASLLLMVTAALAFSCLFAGSAAAATGSKLCSKNETPCALDYIAGTNFKMSLATGTKLKKTGGAGEAIGECTGSTAAGSTTTTGGEATPVQVSLSSLEFSGCTCPVTVVKAGRLVIESIPGTMNGKVRWTEFEFKELCGGIIGECVFGSEVGKGVILKGGTEPVVKFEETAVPKKSGNCGNWRWTATFAISTPKPLYVSGFNSESFPGAGVLCNFETNPCGVFAKPFRAGTAFNAKLKVGISSILEAGFASIKCEESAMSGEIQDPGSSTEPAVVVLSSWTFGGCNCKVEAPKAGSVGIDWTSGSNGALVLSGFEIAVDCGGKLCTFGSSVKEGIALTGGNPATIKATAAPVPKKTGIAECNSTSKWSAEYEVTAPKPLYVAEA